MYSTYSMYSMYSGDLVMMNDFITSFSFLKKSFLVSKNALIKRFSGEYCMFDSRYHYTVLNLLSQHLGGHMKCTQWYVPSEA